jgi:hypothetical protein
MASVTAIFDGIRMLHNKLRSFGAILRGAAAAIHDPRKFATLIVEREDERERRFEQNVRDRFGGPPRTVSIEAVISESIGRLDQFSYLDQTSTVLDLLFLKALASKTFCQCALFRDWHVSRRKRNRCS